jgi:ubiquinone/menaquinone biosynthesis C-methylase UbiE
MRSLLDDIMSQRAQDITRRVQAHLAPLQRIADIGSGTGHNAQCWRETLDLVVDEFDVADLHWVGAGPTLFDGRKVPVSNEAYDGATLFFVLQYAVDAVELLCDVRRVCSGRVVVIQSTYQGRWGRICLALREFFWGRVAFHVARLAGAVRAAPCPLRPRRCFTRDELRQVFTQAGLTVSAWEPNEWRGMQISRDLIVLTAMPERSTSR